MKALQLDQFNYDLPEERIAKYPLKERDQSKLLVYEHGEISHHRFHEADTLLPEDTLLFFNDTKVIPARIFLQKETGATIEIFLLNPVAPTTEVNAIMHVTEKVVWHCMIGNLKKWKDDNVLSQALEIDGRSTTLSARLINRQRMEVEFSWPDNDVLFVDIIHALGQIPLPPYFHREPEEHDKERYQTVYSKFDGAVAAPTAGLHFSENLLSRMKEKGVRQDFLTLHVSAGTFQPIKNDNITEHPMHSEQVVVSRENIERIAEAEGRIIAVGTTSMRTLESLYWFGVKVMQDEKATFDIEKLFPYEKRDFDLPNRKEVAEQLILYMDKKGIDKIVGTTKIFIFPGYEFRICSGLFTNYHLPKSTLILLVAAFIGDDWKEVYEEALEKDYRFLSYGDSSLLLPKNKG
ncbi:MAG: S-adenosylmethionine:tRNA ribosyltransferase-isomerase [Bacteroidota bacterium]